MKILFLIFQTVNVGTGRRAARYASYLSQHGHQVTIIATSPHSRRGVTVTNPEQDMLQVEMPDLLPGSLRSGWDPWNLINRIAWLRDKSFDLVHAFESRPTVIYPALYAHKRGVPLVMDWCDWFGKGGSVEERPNPLVRAVLRPVETYYEEHFRTRANSATVICSVLRQKLIALGMPEEKILNLPNGADLDRYTPFPIDFARAKIRLDPHIPVIGSIGVLFKRDAQLLADAFNLLVKELPDARLLIAGYHNQDFSALVSKPENIIFTGYLSEQDLNLYMSAVDMFWLPIINSNANRGRFPYKLTHYMTMERPIVTSPVGDIPLLFANDEIGLLTPDQPEGYARRTVELLQQPERMKIMGINARQKAGVLFDWHQLTNNLEALYERTLRAHPRGS